MKLSPLSVFGFSAALSLAAFQAQASDYLMRPFQEGYDRSYHYVYTWALIERCHDVAADPGERKAQLESPYAPGSLEDRSYKDGATFGATDATVQARRIPDLCRPNVS